MKFTVDLTERELTQIYYCHMEKLDNIKDAFEIPPSFSNNYKKLKAA